MYKGFIVCMQKAVFNLIWKQHYKAPVL